MLVLCIVGARPNFVKIKPVIDALEGRGAEICLVHTGQHYDIAMSEVFFEELGIRPPDRSLGIGPGTHAIQTARVMMALEPILHDLRPDVVVVVGDVNSTLAAALVVAKTEVPLAHVESGLRSRDWTMPEEVNRVVTDRVSRYLFAPSADAVDNLLAEGLPSGRIHLVGNVMVDTLMANMERALARPVLTRLGLTPGQYGIVTLHRPSNVDDVTVLGSLLRAMGEVAVDCPLVLPAHPRTRPVLEQIDLPAGISMIEPLGYLDFLALEARARVVLTDSGGVQEETTVLGVPCLTVREGTERPITVTEGTNTVVGRDPQRLVETARRIFAEGVVARSPALWDGRAGERIADVLSTLNEGAGTRSVIG